MTHRTRLGSLFAGVGGFDLAGHYLGIDTAFMSEIDTDCQKVLTARFPNAELHGDIEQVDVSKLPDVEIITAGSPCFPAGVLVLTRRGHVPIEEVEVGDVVLTHRNRWRPVTATGSKFAPTGTVKGLGHWGLRCTADHRFWAVPARYDYSGRHPETGKRRCRRAFGEPRWVEARNLPGGWWATPVDYPQADVPPLGVRGTEHYGDADTTGPEFARLVGRWLADGWVRDAQRSRRADGQTWGQVFICGAHDEADVIRKELAATPFTWAQEDGRTTATFRTNSKALARWLTDHFGSAATGKRLPAWVYGTDPEWRQALLDGYLAGDGCWLENTNGASWWQTTTVSRRLAVGIASLSRTLGHVASLSHYAPPDTTKIEGRKVNQRNWWQIMVRPAGRHTSSTVVGGHRFGKVRSWDADGPTVRVYNLTVDEDHSYTVDGIVAKNCQDFSLAGKRAGLQGARSGLFGRFIDVVDEMDRRGCLRWAVWENVPGALTTRKKLCPECNTEWSDSPDGDQTADQRAKACCGTSRRIRDGTYDFEHVVAALGGAAEPVRLPRGVSWNTGLADRGRRAVAWRILDAQHFGVAQRRRRLFAVVAFGDAAAQRACEVLLEPEGRFGDPAASNPPGESTPAGARRSAQADRVQQAVDAAADLGGVPHWLARHAAQALPSGEQTSGRYDTETETFVPAGGAPDLAATLTRGSGRRAPGRRQEDETNIAAVPVGGYVSPRAIRDSYSANEFGIKNGQLHDTLQSDGPGAVAVPDADNDSPDTVRTAQTGANGHGIAVELAHTLDTSNSQAAVTFDQAARARSVALRGRDGQVAAEIADDEVAHALRASQGGSDKPHVLTPAGDDEGHGGCWTKGDENIPQGQRDGRPEGASPSLGASPGTVPNVGPLDGDQIGYVPGPDDCPTIPYVVRRLAPVECERLQGFPDGWTAVDGEGTYVRRYPERVKPNRHARRRGITAMRLQARARRALQKYAWRVAAGTADSTRYRQLGNAVAVPVVWWLLGRIIDADAARGLADLPHSTADARREVA